VHPCLHVDIDDRNQPVFMRTSMRSCRTGVMLSGGTSGASRSMVVMRSLIWSATW